MSEKNTKATENVEIDPGMSVMPEGPGLMDVPTVIPELDSMLAAMPHALPAYQTTVWKNKPSTETPVDAAVMTRVEQRLVDLTNAVNGLRDSVSHIDADVYIHRVAFASGAAIRLNGAEWQTYFLFGSSNICAIIGQRSTGEPSVVNLSGANLTAKRGPGASIDMITTITSGTLAVMSAAPFTVTK